MERAMFIFSQLIDFQLSKKAPRININLGTDLSQGLGKVDSIEKSAYIPETTEYVKDSNAEPEWDIQEVGFEAPRKPQNGRRINFKTRSPKNVTKGLNHENG